MKAAAAAPVAATTRRLIMFAWGNKELVPKTNHSSNQTKCEASGTSGWPCILTQNAWPSRLLCSPTDYFPHLHWIDLTNFQSQPFLFVRLCLSYFYLLFPGRLNVSRVQPLSPLIFHGSFAAHSGGESWVVKTRPWLRGCSEVLVSQAKWHSPCFAIICLNYLA